MKQGDLQRMTFNISDIGPFYMDKEERITLKHECLVGKKFKLKSRTELLRLCFDEKVIDPCKTVLQIGSSSFSINHTKKRLFNQPIGTPIGTAHLRKLCRENNIAKKQLVQSPAEEILKEKTNSELISELTASNHVIKKHKKESGSDSKGCPIQHKNECQNCKRIY